MRFVKRKIYWNYEREEKWLNEQAALGYALVDYSWCRYVFEESEPGEYIYRLELLKNPACDMESQNYIRFMEESGVEHVASYSRWVYFRRKSDKGSFDIYSDIDSRIEHGERVFRLWRTLTAFEMFVGLMNICIAIINVLDDAAHRVFGFSMITGCILLAIGLGFMTLTVHTGRRLARMKRDRALTE